MVFIAAPEATAAPPVGDGVHQPSPVQTATAAKSPPSNGGVAPDTTLYCEAYFAPTLTLETASPRHIHFGGRAFCNYTDIGLWLTINLYTVQGTGDNQHDVFEGQFKIPPTVGTSIGRTWNQGCIGSTSTRWQANLYAGTDEIGTLIPYPLWGSIYTLACG